MVIGLIDFSCINLILKSYLQYKAKKINSLNWNEINGSNIAFLFSDLLKYFCLFYDWVWYLLILNHITRFKWLTDWLYNYNSLLYIVAVLNVFINTLIKIYWISRFGFYIIVYLVMSNGNRNWVETINQKSVFSFIF